MAMSEHTRKEITGSITTHWGALGQGTQNPGSGRAISISMAWSGIFVEAWRYGRETCLGPIVGYRREWIATVMLRGTGTP